MARMALVDEFVMHLSLPTAVNYGTGIGAADAAESFVGDRLNSVLSLSSLFFDQNHSYLYDEFSRS